MPAPTAWAVRQPRRTPVHAVVSAMRLARTLVDDPTRLAGQRALNLAGWLNRDSRADAHVILERMPQPFADCRPLVFAEVSAFRTQLGQHLQRIEIAFARD